ncbi:hypothetical protein CANTEDRAFT_113396 [Yamadazyma tenuis ATCC 10573]|uniref:Uncharacterized protein n=1 Tax=Candida tenuis (strain ATCC 10573 / BCRC 21748 / CBS 615 / JCM 9827 / NBRC 10315 / NRRL Y-1498 / VKM Y-70) TaxID=590646 RepID=G3B285_CANTC|nr:uncharacterized protein CANTEDRAFT_113396 [Yamadazyma tenuis ATCC 10573]EGV64615.1 hypothetical protein CANTEDRAFT_113396 [Yamadazyma tenuis ATCC 10573]
MWSYKLNDYLAQPPMVETVGACASQFSSSDVHAPFLRQHLTTMDVIWEITAWTNYLA